jgi:ElaB/YqjD/DUF883 family membrane-anchored ribosome-binding protein
MSEISGQNMTADFSEELDAIRNDIRLLAEKFLKMLDAKEMEASEKIASEWRAALEALETKTDELAAKARATGDQFAASLDETVQKHPFGTLAAALSIGFVVGALWRK